MLLRRGESLAVSRPRVVRLSDVRAALPLVERLGLRALGVDELLWLERPHPNPSSATAGEGLS